MAAQETFKDARLWTLLLLAMVAFIPVDCIAALNKRMKNLLKFSAYRPAGNCSQPTLVCLNWQMPRSPRLGIDGTPANIPS